MPLTVRELLKTEKFKNSIVLAGDKGLEREVDSASIIESPDGVKWFRGKELVLTTAYGFKGDSEAQKKLIRDLVEKKVGVLAIKLRHLGTLPRVMEEEANKYDFPIITLEDEYSWLDIIEFFLEKNQTKQTEEIKDFKRLFHLLGSKVFKSEDGDRLEVVARELAALTGNKVVLVNTISKEVFSAPSEFTFPEEILDNQKFWTREILKKQISESYDFPLVKYRFKRGKNNYYWVGIEIKIDGVNYCYIWFWEKNASISEGNLLYLDFFVPVVLMELQSVIQTLNIRNKYKNHFLHEVLNGEIESEEEIKFRGIELGWMPPEKVRVVIMEVGQNKVDLEIASISNTIDEFFSEKGVTKNCIWGLDEKRNIVFLVPGDETFNQYIKELQGLMKEKLKFEEIFVGLGKAKRILTQLDESKREADQALKIGRTYYEEKEIFDYFQMGVLRLFVDVDEEKLREYCKEILFPILEYDLEKKTELIKTLEIFFKNKGNYRATARELHLHFNSVKYRLNTVEKLCEMNLDLPEDRLQIEIALKLFPLLQRHKKLF